MGNMRQSSKNTIEKVNEGLTEIENIGLSHRDSKQVFERSDKDNSLQKKSNMRIFFQIFVIQNLP